MVFENTHLSVERGRYDGPRLTVEEDTLRRNDRHVQHPGSALRHLVRVLDHILDAARHEERLLRQRVELTGDETLEG